MDIHSGSGYPASALSNFSPHPFSLDGVQVSSMEGFLQALKFKNPEMQKAVCSLVGIKAKYKGKHKKWWKDQTLYWQGQEIKRDSEAYQTLLNRAYIALYANSDSFRRALQATGNAVLSHSIGKSDSNRTVLTVSEFCGRLMRLRDNNGVL